MKSSLINRRSALKLSTTALGAIIVKNSAMNAAPAPNLYRVKNNRINQSVIQWCFNPMTVEELAVASAPMGLKSVELVGPEHWPMLKKYGLTCAIAGSHGFAKGFAAIRNVPRRRFPFFACSGNRPPRCEPGLAGRSAFWARNALFARVRRW